jgi:hypothetical protein
MVEATLRVAAERTSLEKVAAPALLGALSLIRRIEAMRRLLTEGKGC